MPERISTNMKSNLNIFLRQSYTEFSMFEKMSLAELKKSMYGIMNIGGVSISILKNAFQVIDDRFLNVTNISLISTIFPENL